MSTVHDDSSVVAARLGCEHYRRKCELLAPCCGEWFVCRVCHDTLRNDAEMDVKKAHVLDRRAVTRVRCLVCRLEQAPARVCAGSDCGVVLGEYFCGVCNLFDDDGGPAPAKALYHCDGCGLCRVGPKANFFHCDGCSSCLAAESEKRHVCPKGYGLKSECPVCLEYMHTSRQPSVFFRCGHAMHLRELKSAGRAPATSPSAKR